LRDVARRIQSREISPVELTTRMLDRIAAVDGKLKSYATVMREQALEAAKRAEEEIQRGRYRGPLHGVPIAVKDLCYTKGVRTMAGTSIYAGFLPDYDATVVTKLSQAGAVLLGKLNLTEGAMGGYNPARDIPVNPWGEDLWPGASSSGSGVATAAGLCYGSIGTDTGGSIRFPSAANGIVGLKPTYGRVSRYGVFPLAESLDHVGPMVRRAGDAAVMFEVMAGFDSNDPTSLRDPVPHMLDELEKGVRGLRVGFDRRFATEGIAGTVRADRRDALRQRVRSCRRQMPVQMPDAIIPENVGHSAPKKRLPLTGNTPSHKDEYSPFSRGFLMQTAIKDEDHAKAPSFASTSRQNTGTCFPRLIPWPVGRVGAPTPSQKKRAQYGSVRISRQQGQIEIRMIPPRDFGLFTFGVCRHTDDHASHRVLDRWAAVQHAVAGQSLSEPTMRIGHAYEKKQPVEGYKGNANV
jgi:amidase